MWGNVEKCKWIYFRENSVSGAAQTKKKKGWVYIFLHCISVIMTLADDFVGSVLSFIHRGTNLWPVNMDAVMWHYQLSPVKFTFWWWLWSCLGQSLLSVSVCDSRNSVLNLFPHNGPLHSIKNLQNKNEHECFVIFFISKSVLYEETFKVECLILVFIN